MGQIIVKRLDGSSYPLSVKKDVTIIKEARQTWALMGDDIIKITIESPYPQRYEIGDYFSIFGRDYKLNQLPKVSKTGVHKYAYELTFEGVQYDLLRAFYDVTIETTGNTLQDVQGDALTGNLHRFATVLVSNANRVFPDKWRLGTCPDTVADKTLTFGDGDNCLAVFQSLCKAFDVEGDIVQQAGVYTLNFKQQTGTTHTYTFEFGKGKGLYALSREHVDSSNIVTRLKVFGSDGNITHKYRANRLCLPGKTKAQSFIEQAEAVRKYGVHEARKVFEDIKPTFNGKVSEIISGNVLQFKDANMFDLNAKEADGKTTKYLIAGVSAKIHFNTGNLAGYEFDIHKYDHATKTFTLKKLTDDRGEVFPSARSTAFQFAVGDEYKILDVALPEQYEAEAERKLQEQANEYYRQNSQPKVKYGLSVSKEYLQKLFGTRGTANFFSPGDYVNIKDDGIGVNKAVRIQSLQRNLLDVYDYSLTISDTVESSIATRVISELVEIDKITTIHQLKDPARARANWRSSREVLAMVFDPEGDYYTDKIKPNSIDTLALSVGAKSMQFALQNIVFEPNYNGNKNTIHVTSGSLIHYALDAKARTWLLPELTYTFEQDSQAYYIYAKCGKASNRGAIVFSTEAIKADEDPMHYHFWIGVVNSVDSAINARAVALTYGFTTVNGRFIRTGRIESVDGQTYVDLDKGEIGGRIVLKNGRTIEELEEGRDGRDAVAHYAYADAVLHASDGSVRQVIGFSHTPREQAWLGHYTDYNTLDSGNPLDYRWLRVQGRDGAKGKDGAKGEKGDKGEDGSDGRPGRDGRDGNDGRPGSDGQNGANGQDGRSIVRTTPQYQAVDRAELSAIRSWAWSEEAPAWQYGKWLAVRWRIQYDRGADSYSEPYISLDWEVVGKVRQMAYLTEALQGSTQIDGGLLLTRLVGVASSNDYSDNGSRAVTAYLNGSHNPRPGDKGKRIAFACGVAHFGAPRETRTGEIFHDGDVRFGNFIVGRNDQGENIALFVDPKTQDASKPLIRIGGYQTALSQLMGQYTDAQTQTLRPNEVDHKLRFSFGRWQREEEHKRVNIEGERMTLKDGATATITGRLRVEISLARYCSAGSRNSLNMDRLTGFAAIRVEAYVTLGERKSLVGEYSCDLADTETCQEVDLPINLKHTGLKGGRYAPSIEVVAVVINPPKEVEQTIEVKPKGEVTFSARDVDPDVQEVVFSHRGISAFYGKNRFVYISNDSSRLEPVLSVRGLVDVPGVLFALRVEVVGSSRVRIKAIWGKHAPADQSVGDYLDIDPRDNAVYVGHTIGHTNYAISLTSEKQDVISSYTHVERGGFWVRQRNLDDSKRGIKHGFSVVCTGYNYDITK